MFKHNICGSQPEVPNCMLDSFNPLPSEFFTNPRCPFLPAVIEKTTTEVDLIESAKDLEENAFLGDQNQN